jgi:hypothetical protein
VTLPLVTYAVSGAVVRPKSDGVRARIPSMTRIRLAWDAESWVMEPLPTRPVSMPMPMPMPMPSKSYFVRIGTMVATNLSATAVELRSMPAVGADDREGRVDRVVRPVTCME